MVRRPPALKRIPKTPLCKMAIFNYVQLQNEKPTNFPELNYFSSVSQSESKDPAF